MLDWLRANRERIENELGASPEHRYFSPTTYGQYQATWSLVRDHVRGTVIDLGCGYAPFREQLAGRITVYHTLDLWPRIQTTYVGDIQDLHMIPDGTYNAALSLEVLEHVPDPFRAVKEIYRILRPGAVTVISVPHLSRIHDAPNDYYRYTRFGVEYMLTQAGFEVVELRSKGGLFCFLGHQLSTLLLGIVWGVPGIRQIVWQMNKWLITKPLYVLDRAFDRKGFFALGYVVAARKPL